MKLMLEDELELEAGWELLVTMMVESLMNVPLESTEVARVVVVERVGVLGSTETVAVSIKRELGRSLAGSEADEQLLL